MFGNSAHGCGLDAAAQASVPVSEMDIRRPLYLFLANGRFVKRDLSTGFDTVLSEHGFNEATSTVRSSDGRWLSYSGNIAHRNLTQYWLYDYVGGQDRLVLEHPSWGGSIPAFSPDGRYLAIAANYDTRWPDANAAGVYVIDTATLKRQRLDIPTKLPAVETWASTEWSSDGSRLLLMTHGTLDGSYLREYWSWRPGARQASQAEGRMVDDGPGVRHDAWFVEGKEVELHRQGGMRGRSVGGLLSTADGGWVASVDDNGILRVAGKDGRLLQADKAPYDACEGFSILPIGWIDSGHLVYRKPGGLVFIYEPSTQHVSRLLGDDPARSYDFDW